MDVIEAPPFDESGKSLFGDGKKQTSIIMRCRWHVVLSRVKNVVFLGGVGHKFRSLKLLMREKRERRYGG